MAIYVDIDGNGVVQSCTSSRYAVDGMAPVFLSAQGPVAPGEIWAAVPMSVHDAARCFVQGGWLTPRPASPVPYVDAGQIIVPPCPAGTTITVFDLSGEELMGEVVADTDDFAEVIGFTDPGTYEVEVAAPLPHLPTTARITI